MSLDSPPPPVDVNRASPSASTASPSSMSRRALLQAAGAGVGVTLGGELLRHVAGVVAPSTSSSASSSVLDLMPNDIGASTAAAQEAAAATPTLTSLNRFPRMVHEHYVQLVRGIESQSSTRRNEVRTKAQAEAYVADVRRRIQTCFGPWPERTPLNARVTGVVERDTYRIEKVIFESRPEFLVTANLYVPKKIDGKAPGVVASCGHSVNGKAGDAYQSFAQGLARFGYVVLIFDPIGQGERLQYVDADLKPRRGVGTSEHLYAGNQQFLVGEFFGSWRAWDGIRALDYLLTRPEVDEKRVGITGNSGGGTMTTWLCGVEQRWTMAAPGCFVTTFRRNLENELPADTEQCPPRALSLGLDHSDFLAALAPKPVIILAKERDYFDVRGATEAYERLKRLYTLLGAPDNIALQIGPTEHGYSQENREAMYGWFNRAVGFNVDAKEPPITIEKDETLYCTPRGQVAELKSKTVFSFTQAKSRELAARRRPPSAEDLPPMLTRSLHFWKNPDANPEYRILRPLPARGYPSRHATTYAVEVDRDMFALVTRLSDQAHYSRPPQGQPRATLYVAHHSSDAELRGDAWVRELVKSEPDSPFYACDVRGIGESRPDTCGAEQFTRPYGSDFFYAIHGLMLGSPYVGGKTLDVLTVMQWLASNGVREIHLAAKGWGTVPATFAAVLAPKLIGPRLSIARISLKDRLESYASLAESEDYAWPLSSFVPGELANWDLPDCYRVLKI